VEYQFTGPWSSAHAELALWQACPAQAVAAIEDGLARLERTDDVRYRIRLLRLGTRAAADLAEVARDRRDGVAETQAVDFAAALRARTAAAIARVADMDGGLAIELAAEVATVAAEESRLRGSSDPSAWHEAAERWFARVRPYHRGYARWREAEASLEHGDRAAAAEALRDAGGAAASLGARPLHDAIAALARRARIPLDRQPQVGGRDASMTDHPGAAVAAELGLTPREVDVLDLVARGMTNRQIADTLFISVYTAGVHVSRILGKLGATSRTEAASKAYRLGLVSR
jgi:DNA-binding CsgD family transcriptional regulator